MASGLIVAELLELLRDKGILNVVEIRDVLNKSLRGLSPIIQTTTVGPLAGEFITGLLRAKFPSPK